MREKIKKILKKEIIAILAILILSFPAYRQLLLKGYFPMHDDIQVMRLWEMEKCFLDGQIPCRWAPDMGAGYGQPLFNFYSVFPYYFGMFFRLFGFQFVDIVKILFLLSLVLSGFFIYLLAKEFLGRFAAVGAALFYVYAPYHAVDIYVRGALAEAWALTFFPLIFYAIYKFIKEEKLVWFVLVTFSLSGLFLTHNLMNMIFSPFVLLWSIFVLLISKKGRLAPKLLLALAWALGLSAFFLLPVLMERNLINVKLLTQEYFDFHNHFVYKGQLLFLRLWGYGGSQGARSEMSFQIGWPHWWLVPLAFFLIVYSIFKKKYLKPALTSLFFVLIFLFSSFLTHRDSAFIWESIPLLSFVQFPWRFLGLAIFGVSFIAGTIIYFLKAIPNFKVRYLLAGIIVASVIVLNFQYFKPENNYPGIDDKWKLSGTELETQMASALLDYLPKEVKQIPETLAPQLPWVVEGEAKISQYVKRSNFLRFTIDASSAETKVKIPVFNFPRWEVLIDQELVDFNSDNPQGVIELSVPQGSHTVVGFFCDTAVRSLANVISTVSFVSLIALIIIKNQKNEKTV
ncbi:MAG TPA: glycosyltransferase family 39 protein [Clostridia bacterium]|nr:glycosyltransferase family 39 protein [Clostridia bacterium]